MNNNSVSLSKTSSKGIQMSDEWINQTITEMRYHPTDKNLQRIGDVLYKNRSKIEKIVTSIDKGKKEIVIIKLNDF